MLFPFAYKLYHAYRKPEVGPCDGDFTSESKADVLLTDCSDRENKGGAEGKTSPHVTDRRDDVMNGEGLQKLNTTVTRHLTADNVI